MSVAFFLYLKLIINMEMKDNIKNINVYIDSDGFIHIDSYIIINSIYVDLSIDFRNTVRKITEIFEQHKKKKNE